MIVPISTVWGGRCTLVGPYLFNFLSYNLLNLCILIRLTVSSLSLCSLASVVLVKLLVTPGGVYWTISATGDGAERLQRLCDVDRQHSWGPSNSLCRQVPHYRPASLRGELPALTSWCNSILSLKLKYYQSCNIISH